MAQLVPAFICSRKRPIDARPFAVILVSVSLSVLVADRSAIAANLTESEAVQLGLAESAIGDVATGGVQQAEGQRERARRWPNPVLSYQREETATGAGTTEQYGWVAQTIDMAGRRSTRGRAAEHRVRAAAADGEDLRVERCAAIRQRFYATLLEQRRVTAMEQWVLQGERVVEIVTKRRTAGDASGYDEMRIAREQATARARLATERASLARNREQLLGLIGTSRDGDTLWGELLPSEPLPAVDALLGRVDERPDVRALDESVEAARLEGSAAARWWLPDVTVGAGVKSVEDERDRFSGPFLSASIPLPVLDQDQGARFEAEGRERVARGQKALVVETARADLRGLWHEASTLHATAIEFRRSALGGSEVLMASAERAYEAGEMDLLVLLDAHRSALDAELQALELEMSARRARIELDRTVGDLP